MTATAIPIPAFEPMLPQTADAPFDSPDWAFEPKLDGMRIMAFREGSSVRLMTRAGIDNAADFPWLVEAIRNLPLTRVVLDGEVVALDSKGIPSFPLLQNRLTNRARLAFYVFDLLWFDDRNVSRETLSDRRQLLEALFLAIPSESPIKLNGSVPGQGNWMFEQCLRFGLEGVVAKRLRSRYASGKRTDTWLKVKKGLRDEFVIGGYTPGTGWRADTFGALVLGYYPAGSNALRYVGNVGSGFDTAALKRLLPMLRAIDSDASPFDSASPAPTAGSRAPGEIQYVRPELVAEVAYQERTTDGLLRFPVFLGLRSDKTPRQAGPERERSEVLDP